LLTAGSHFRKCRFVGSPLAGLDIDSLVLEHCDLEEADCTGFTCGDFRMSYCQAEGACFERSDIKESVLEYSQFPQANFRMARLNLSKIVGCDLSSCRFEGANLFGADIADSRLMAVDLSTAKTDGIGFRNVGLNMAGLRNKEFRKHKFVGVDLSEADLTGSDFSQATFEDCVLHSPLLDSDTRFDGADLRGAKVGNLRIDRASFKGALFTTSQAGRLMEDRFGIIVDDGQ